MRKTSNKGTKREYILEKDLVNRKTKSSLSINYPDKKPGERVKDLVTYVKRKKKRVLRDENGKIIKGKDGKTNYWPVNLNSREGIKLCKSNNNTVLGLQSIKAKTKYNILASKKSRGWTKINYGRDTQTTLIKMCNSILELAKGKKWSTVTFRLFEHADGNYDYVEDEKDNRQVKQVPETTDIFRSLTIRDDDNGKRINAKELYGEVAGMIADVHFHGSDAFGAKMDIDTTFFALSYKENIGNSKINRTDNGSKKKTKYFYSKSFKCADGDCLLAIICNGHKIKTIRKDLDLPDGGVDVKYMDILENYLKININVYDDAIKTKKIILDTDHENKTHAELDDYVYFYKSESEYEETYNILLHDNHYTLITKFRPIFFDKICGDELKLDERNPKRPIPLSKMAIEQSILGQGRPFFNPSYKYKEKKKITRKEKADEEKKGIRLRAIFFDVETIFNRKNTNLLEVYSVAWCSADLKDMISVLVEPLEKEADVDERIKNTHFESGHNSMAKFVEWLVDNEEDGVHYYLIGYNNSRFDNFPLIKELINNDLLNNVLYVNNSLLKVYFGGSYETFDLCRFTMCSLKSACEDFQTLKKVDGFSHFIPQDAFNRNGWSGLMEWVDNNKKELIRYNKIDVLATQSLFNVVRKAYLTITGRDILQYTTLASLSYKAFASTNKTAKPVETMELDEEIRESYIGGRCQNFKTKKFNEWDGLKMFDVKSLYPYIMLNRAFPTGEAKYTKNFKKDKLGIYNVRIISQPKIKIIPSRDGTLNWDDDGEITARLTSVEINALDRYGCEYEFIPWNDIAVKCIGIYWESYSTNLFTNFFEPIKNEKTNQDIYKKKKDDKYNPALRNICKLLLNSLSGKMGQRNYETSAHLCKNNDDEKKVESKCNYDSIHLKFQYGDYRILEGDKKTKFIYNNNTAKPSQISAFIYAWSRIYMYDTIFSNYDAMYTDTDSALLRRDDGEDFEKKFIKTCGEQPHIYHELSSKGIKTLGDDFGQFEEELGIKDKDGIEAHILAKKLYCIEIIDEKGQVRKDKSKYKLKGVNIKRDILLSHFHLKKINSLEGEEKNDYMHELHKNNEGVNHDLILAFRQLSEQGVCYFATSQLKKADFNIKQIYSIKKISISDDNEVIEEEINE